MYFALVHCHWLKAPCLPRRFVAAFTADSDCDDVLQLSDYTESSRGTNYWNYMQTHSCSYLKVPYILEYAIHLYILAMIPTEIFEQLLSNLRNQN